MGIAYRGALLLAGALAFCIPAQAQLFRAYVSSAGNDANPCTLQQPCRLLPRALSAVASGGEIWMLDSANFNTSAVDIAKSVSILAVPGAVGSVMAAGFDPAVNITTPGITVALRNLVIGALPGATGFGVFLGADAQLSIEGTLIAGVVSGGIQAIGPGHLRVTDCVVRSTQNYAIRVQDGMHAEISGTRMLLNASGGVLVMSQTAALTSAVISDSIVSRGREGVDTVARDVAGAVARATLTRSTIEGVTYALHVTALNGASSSLSVSGSTISNSEYAWYVDGAATQLRSHGNNNFGEGQGTVGSLTPVGTM